MRNTKAPNIFYIQINPMKTPLQIYNRFIQNTYIAYIIYISNNIYKIHLNDLNLEILSLFINNIIVKYFKLKHTLS